MQIILVESVEGLGRPGDQVRVKSGYARNYLLPRGLAVSISADALRSLGKLRVKAETEERERLSSMQELAGKIAGTTLRISARATEEGHLFGSVADRDIHAALLATGWELPLRAVRLPAPFKDAGLHELELHLHGGITAAIRVEVVPIDAEGNVIQPGGGADEERATADEQSDQALAAAESDTQA